ncbi:MAG: DNA-directed RNA polymerase subunit alpha C-terminal domain-containing protein [Eubacteriales bacterium]
MQHIRNLGKKSLEEIIRKLSFWDFPVQRNIPKLK